MLVDVLPASGHVRLHRLWAFANFQGDLTTTEHLHILYCPVCHLSISVCLQSETFGAALKALNREDDRDPGDGETKAGWPRNLFAFETRIHHSFRHVSMFLTDRVGARIAEFAMFDFMLGGNPAMAVQGRSLDDFQIHRIVSLLARTDLSLNEIAERMGCSHSLVAAINRRYEVRDYAGRRSRWTVTQEESWSEAS